MCEFSHRSSVEEVIRRGPVGIFAEAGGGVRLWIEIDDQRVLACLGEAGCKVHGSRGLPDATLLVGKGEDGSGHMAMLDGWSEIMSHGSRSISDQPSSQGKAYVIGLCQGTLASATGRARVPDRSWSKLGNNDKLSVFRSRVFPPINGTAAELFGHGLDSQYIGGADEENGDTTRRDQR